MIGDLKPAGEEELIIIKNAVWNKEEKICSRGNQKPAVKLLMYLIDSETNKKTFI